MFIVEKSAVVSIEVDPDSDEDFTLVQVRYRANAGIALAEVKYDNVDDDGDLRDDEANQAMAKELSANILKKLGQVGEGFSKYLDLSGLLSSHTFE